MKKNNQPNRWRGLILIDVPRRQSHENQPSQIRKRQNLFNLTYSKMKNLLSIALLFLSISSFGQDYIEYFNSANEAEYQLSLGNFTEARTIFKNLEEVYTSLKPKDNFYLGIIAYLFSDTIEGYKYLSESATKLVFASYHIQDYKRIFPQLKISEFAINNIKNIEVVTQNQCNKKIFDTLSYFLDQDQLNRNGHLVVNREVDTRNQQAFLKYLKANGIPDIVAYGDATISTLVLHMYDEGVFSEFKAYLLKELKKGNIYPNYFAAMVDRHQYDYHRPKIYNAYFSEKISDPDKLKEINSKRLSIGLSIHFKGNNILPIPDFTHGNFNIDGD